MEAASPQRAEERPRGVGAGLWNLGNTCYVNAALQCLTHTAPLAGDLRVRRHSETCAKPRSCVLCAMQAHVSRAFQHAGDVIEPPKQLFASFHRQQQEDAHEYLMFTLDALQQACVREQGPLAGASPDATLIRQVFGGYWRSQIKCLRCHGVSDTLDPYLDVALDIQGAQSVAQALEALVTPERLDGDNSYECSVCLEKVPACKTLTLHAASKVLILALKRFSPFTGSKKEKVVRYPERLDVQPYLSGQNPGPLVYELYAVLVHAGRDCHNGHYFCYVKAADGQWFKMNDEKVTACAVSTALRQRAYVLFYVQETAVERGHAGPGPQRPVQETSFQDTTLEEWRQLQEPSRPRARYNLRKGEGAPPASSGRIRLPGNRGGRRQHPQGKENCLPDSAGGGKARATKSRRKGMRSLRGIP